MTYKLFADGACRPNPGVGGWAFILQDPQGHNIAQSGAQEQSTNNQMELQAVVEGLTFFRKQIYSGVETLLLILDSKYVLDGIKIWSHDWKKHGWTRKNKKPIINLERWKSIYNLTQGLEMQFQHIKGHSGHPENEQCDTMAVDAIQGEN